MTTSGTTVWIFGDQLHRGVGALRDRRPEDTRVLLVESEAKLRSKRWHRQRLHLVLSGMAHLAAELTDAGFEVDHRRAPTLAAGLAAHRAAHRPDEVVAMAPMSWDGVAMLDRCGVTTIPNEQFLCHPDDFARWAEGRKSLKMEDFYRWQRLRLDVLLDHDDQAGPAPAGGRWNFDHDNREPPPKDGRSWPTITRFELDHIDRDVLARVEEHDVWGDEPTGLWPVTRDQALVRLEEFVTDGLAPFGPHEDAMLRDEWKLAHSVLSSSLNLGLLHPREVVTAVESAWRARPDELPLNSVEGFIRQVIGWREYVWGLYWLWMPDYRNQNALGADCPVPPAFTGQAQTELACVSSVIGNLERYGWTHHIERLMVLGNLALTTGVDPLAMTEWMWASFVDGAEWVMLPNVIGMALHADGGRMATKPYASGGAYINKMSDFCRGCRFNPKKRTGDDACPFTTLYWDFLARTEQQLTGNHRMARQLAAMRRLSDLDAVRARADEVRVALAAGQL
ncbi:MAG: cryptochrome/photolyase family protein [Actinomycetota bacterium]